MTVVHSVATAKRPYIALIVSSLLWGSMYPAAKPVLTEVSPLHLAAVRASVACIVLASIVIGRGDARELVQVARRHFVETLLLGITSFFLSTLLAMMALELLPASVNGLLNNLSPLWLAVGAAIFVRAGNSRRLIVGAIVAFVGVALVLLRDATPDDLLALGALNPVGVALSLAGSCAIAASTLVGRRLMVKADPLVAMAVASAVGAFLYAPLIAFGPGVAPLLVASVPAKALLLYVGVGCTAVNFALWFSALKVLPAARAAPFQYLIPPFGVVLSALLIHEPLTLPLVVGTALIIAGIVVAQGQKQRRAASTRLNT